MRQKLYWRKGHFGFFLDVSQKLDENLKKMYCHENSFRYEESKVKNVLATDHFKEDGGYFKVDGDHFDIGGDHLELDDEHG